MNTKDLALTDSQRATHTSHMELKAYHVTAALAAAFKAAGWKILKSGSLKDKLVEKGGRRVVLELKVSNGRPRLNVLEHSLAAAALMAQRQAKDLSDNEKDAVEPLAAVGAPRLTSSMVQKLSAFADRYLPDTAWCIVDAAGVRAARGIGLRVVEESLALPPKARVTASTPFSDLGQWLLKVLFSTGLDPQWIQGGRQKTEFRTARELARYARVSEPVVSVVLRELDSRGFLERRPVIRLVDRSRLLRDWTAAVRAKPPAEASAHLNSAPDSPSPLNSLGLDAQSSCLGLFSACESHGIDAGTAAPKHVLVRTLSSSTLETLGLRPCKDDDPSRIVVREVSFPESVFRGVLTTLPPTADGLQCWLDLIEHSEHGTELASDLWRAMNLDFEQP